MRYESPLNADAFRRESLEDEESPRRESQRVTVRPLAGAVVGTTFRVSNRVVLSRVESFARVVLSTLSVPLSLDSWRSVALLELYDP
jgi:hypothetical protein